MLGITVRATPGTMEMIENKWPIIGKCQKVYVKVKNEYDVSSFGDFPLNQPEVRLYGHSKKVISIKNHTKKTGKKKSARQSHRPEDTKKVANEKALPEIGTRFQAFSCQN